MDLLAIGGDLRYAYLVRAACRDGLRAAAFGLEKAALDVPHAGLSQIGEAENIVLPNPFARGLQMPLAADGIAPEDALAALRPGARVMLFGPGEVPGEWRERFHVIDLNADERLALRNAHYTAEGAVMGAMERLPCALSECPTLVIGYGRVGRALCRVLRGMGARVTVAARRKEAREEARLRGAEAVDLRAMRERLTNWRLILSTPPERVLDAADVCRARKDALLIDLSSPPYGVDLEAALAAGIDARREPGLPGRCCPQSAGEALYEAVRVAMEREEEAE